MKSSSSVKPEKSHVKFQEHVETTAERKTRNGSVISVDVAEEPPHGADLRKLELINDLKAKVKHIMEVSVEKKQLCINSTPFTSLCIVVESCLLDGLRRRLLGLFGVRTTFALLHTIAKNCGVAANVIKYTSELQQAEGSSNDYLWLKVALHERVLCTIVDYIFNNPQCRRYYEKDSLMLDPLRGGMVAAILVGPCTVDYILKPMDMNYRDPTADELVQRHRITSTASAPASSPKKRSLSIVKRGNSILQSAETNALTSTFNRDYVFSLHQNMRSSLLYGKNNVAIVTGTQNDVLKGYLSLHREHNGLLTVKWTPNQLMHSSSEPGGPGTPPNKDGKNKSKLWKYCVNINMQNIIYLHLHQHGEQHPVSLVFVDTEGVQYAPFQFPPGQHCLAFLACLETGLNPLSRLDPPLWNDNEKGKILPRLRRKTSFITTHRGNGMNGNVSMEITDYVFRIVHGNSGSIMTSNSETKSINKELEEISFEEVGTPEEVNDKTNMTAYSQSVPVSPYIKEKKDSVNDLVKNSLGNACESMRLQILSRAFYGWLAYCRHLKTIRTHLSGLVTITTLQYSDAEAPVDEAFWHQCRESKSEDAYARFVKRCYLYGIKPELRQEIWPYLIKAVPWQENTSNLLSKWEDRYLEDIEKWSAIEVEVNRRDEEAFQAARLRQSSAHGDLNFPPIRECSINNDVFEEESCGGSVNQSMSCCDESETLIDEFGLNLHRIEKDVDRCDRITEFFSKTDNLKRLKSIMCTYVWRHIHDGYVQGMCDIAAPLLVIFENEYITLECFEKVMERMRVNFPHGNGIDESLGNLRAIVQVMDPQLFELLMSNADFTHLYFAYRWFLLDFKRELTYENVYKVWEVIMAAGECVTPRFQLFFAMALLTKYREIVIENNMDFTDIIKFYNEMAEKHNTPELLEIARSKVESLQSIIRELN